MAGVAAMTIPGDSYRRGIDRFRGRLKQSNSRSKPNG
jgi:hypothetical protein